MIADTFIKRPVTAIVISIVIVLVGLLALSQSAGKPISGYYTAYSSDDQQFYRSRCANC